MTREDANNMLAVLDSMILENTKPLSEKEKTKGRLMIEKITKFVTKLGSELDDLDDLRAKLSRISKELSEERIRTSNLEMRIKSMENERQSQSALIKSNELATLFRAYFLDLDWGAVTTEYSIQRDNYENRKLSLAKFETYKVTFNAKYPTPEDSPVLSVIIDMCQDGHEVAHSGGVKTVVRQEKFIADCAQFFAECGYVGKYTAPCLAMLYMLQKVQTTGGLRSLN